MWSRLRSLMARQDASGVITATIPMSARPMDTTVLIGSWAECSSVRAPGTTAAGMAAAGVAGTDTVGAMAIEAATVIAAAMPVGLVDLTAGM